MNRRDLLKGAVVAAVATPVIAEAVKPRATEFGSPPVKQEGGMYRLDDAYGHHFGPDTDVCVECGLTAEQCVDNPQPCIIRGEDFTPITVDAAGRIKIYLP